LNFSSDSLQSFIESLRRYLSESKDRENVYEETIADLTRTRQLLGLSASEEICRVIEKLIADRNQLHEKQRNLEAALQERRAEQSRAAQSLARFEDEIGALRQWEIWARRLHRIVYESVCSTYSSNQLRLALEDTLLAAVSHRSLLNRLNSLREQKKALLSCDPDVLRNRSEVRPSMFAAIAVCVAALRLQRLAGGMRLNTEEVSYRRSRKPELEEEPTRERTPARTPLFSQFAFR
jgi:chromosome segregation ATPase